MTALSALAKLVLWPVQTERERYKIWSQRNTVVVRARKVQVANVAHRLPFLHPFLSQRIKQRMIAGANKSTAPWQVILLESNCHNHMVTCSHMTSTVTSITRKMCEWLLFCVVFSSPRFVVTVSTRTRIWKKFSANQQCRIDKYVTKTNSDWDISATK